MNTKANITTLFDTLIKNDDLSFIDNVKNVEIFIHKLSILCGKNFENFNELISHKKANVQSRTNQNFYLLWVALNKVSIDTVTLNAEDIFVKIKGVFDIFQNVPDDFTIEKFINTIENIA